MSSVHPLIARAIISRLRNNISRDRISIRKTLSHPSRYINFRLVQSTSKILKHIFLFSLSLSLSLPRTVIILTFLNVFCNNIEQRILFSNNYNRARMTISKFNIPCLRIFKWKTNILIKINISRKIFLSSWKFRIVHLSFRLKNKIYRINFRSFDIPTNLTLFLSLWKKKNK